MTSRVVMSLDNVFLRCLGPNTITSVFTEFSIRKLQVIQAFISSRHVCSLVNWLLSPGFIEYCLHDNENVLSVSE